MEKYLTFNHLREFHILVTKREVVVKKDKCPENGILLPSQFISAFGKTEAEAKAKIMKKLREIAKKARADNGSPCQGDCVERGSECMTLATIDSKNGFSCSPAESKTQGDGFICIYDGPLTAECYCPELV